MRWIRPERMVWFLFMMMPLIAAAQQESGEKGDSTRVTCRERLEELEKRVERLQRQWEQKAKEEELQKLLEEAARLKSAPKARELDVGKKFHTGVRQQAGLNPNLSVSGDFFAGLSSRNTPFIKQPGEFSYGSNGFFLRELEVSLIAPLDPFTRGKSFISYEDGAFGVDEAYMEWLNLPLNLNLKVGVFAAEFGILNRYHNHALPQFDRPKVLRDFFTNERLAGVGVAGNFLLKPLFGADASLLDVTIIQGGHGQTFTERGDRNLLAIGNFTSFYDLTKDTFFEWRIGTVGGYNDPSETYKSWVTNLSMNLKWIPAARSKYRTFDWKTECLVGWRETPIGTIRSKGFYTSVQNKLNARWWITGRLDYSELPYDNQQHEWAATLGFDFWQSEFVFMRFQYQYSKRDFTTFGDGPLAPDDHSFVLQMNWAMGPHKHEAY